MSRNTQAAAAIEQEFWRHVPGSPAAQRGACVAHQTARVKVKHGRGVDDYVPLLTTYPTINRNFIGQQLKCDRFDVATQYQPAPRCGWVTMKHFETYFPERGKPPGSRATGGGRAWGRPRFASVWPFGRLPDGRCVVLLNIQYSIWHLLSSH
jgi:hypothetical protein